MNFFVYLFGVNIVRLSTRNLLMQMCMYVSHFNLFIFLFLPVIVSEFLLSLLFSRFLFLFSGFLLCFSFFFFFFVVIVIVSIYHFMLLLLFTYCIWNSNRVAYKHYIESLSRFQTLFLLLFVYACLFIFFFAFFNSIYFLISYGL